MSLGITRRSRSFRFEIPIQKGVNLIAHPAVGEHGITVAETADNTGISIDPLFQE
jgi:hypothetical protein